MATTSYSQEERLITPVTTAHPGPTTKSSLVVAVRYTLVTAVLLGIVYPLVITGIAQLTMRKKADGQLIVRNGEVIGSAIIGQGFTSPSYFHSRPSAAGNGWDATNSGGSNLAQSNKALVTRIDAAVADWQKLNPGQAGADRTGHDLGLRARPGYCACRRALSGADGGSGEALTGGDGSGAGRVAYPGPGPRVPG